MLGAVSKKVTVLAGAHHKIAEQNANWRAKFLVQLQWPKRHTFQKILDSAHSTTGTNGLSVDEKRSVIGLIYTIYKTFDGNIEDSAFRLDFNKVKGCVEGVKEGVLRVGGERGSVEGKWIEEEVLKGGGGGGGGGGNGRTYQLVWIIDDCWAQKPKPSSLDVGYGFVA